MNRNAYLTLGEEEYSEEEENEPTYFRLIELLGEGGFGKVFVYEMSTTECTRNVALKTLKARPCCSEYAYKYYYKKFFDIIINK